MEAPTKELARALDELAELWAGKRPPNRFDVRALFIPLGALVAEQGLDGLPSDLSGLLDQATTTIRADSEPWQTALHEELAYAADEFCLSVDPRYLDLPNYDFTYTRHSRCALEHRIRAARHLELTLPDGLEARISESDAALAPYQNGPANQ